MSDFRVILCVDYSGSIPMRIRAWESLHVPEIAARVRSLGGEVRQVTPAELLQLEPADCQGSVLYAATHLYESYRVGVNAAIASFLLKGGRVSPPIRFQPVRFDRDRMRLIPVEDQERERVLQEMESRNQILRADGQLDSLWNEHVWNRRHELLSGTLAGSRIARKLWRVTGFLPYLFTRNAIRSTLANVRCESHREALISLLNRMSQTDGIRPY